MSRYVTACPRGPCKRQLPKQAKARRTRNTLRTRENESERFLQKARPWSRSALIVRKIKAIEKVWQAMTSTALFGVTAYKRVVHKAAG